MDKLFRLAAPRAQIAHGGTLNRRNRRSVLQRSGGLLLACALAVGLMPPAKGAENIENGERMFQACAACHSLKPGRHLTGPSLAGIWGRRAGTAEGFTRYSPALKAAGIIWDWATLDAWLTDPQAVIPGNYMTFPGIKEAQPRADLIAYLKAVSENPKLAQDERSGGMMQSSEIPDLKALGPEQQVAAIRYCGDTYQVTTVAGETFPIWEFNLRFKTDSSDKGPPKGRPALLPAGMGGDRASVIFADPAEISASIEHRC